MLSKEAKYFYRGKSDIPSICRYCYKHIQINKAKKELEFNKYVNNLKSNWEKIFNKKFPKQSQYSVECETCGGTMYLYKSELDRQKFCSPECVATKFIMLKCLICKNIFFKPYRKGGANQKTCSDNCSNKRKLQREQQARFIKNHLMKYEETK